MKRKYIKRTIGIAFLLIVTAVFVDVAQKLVANDGESESLNLQGYYLEDRDSLDLVVMGASEVMNGYSAPEVYRTAGMTSYPYAFAVNPVTLWKYELKDIERTQHPQTLVIDINGAVYLEDEYINSEECQRLLAENMPLSADLLLFALKESKYPMESLFPIIKYHYRWHDAGEAYVKDREMMFGDGYNRLRGAKSPLYRDQYSLDEIYEADDEKETLNADADKALREFLEECRKSEIPNIVFVEFPHILNSEKSRDRHRRVNTAAEIVREAGFDFIDFTKEEDQIGFDYDYDFYDTHHLRAPGQRKFSVYLGQVLMEKYGLSQKKQTENNKKEWADSVSLTEIFYEYFDRYVKEHSDHPYDEAPFVLLNTRRTIDELEKMP